MSKPTDEEQKELQEIVQRLHKAAENLGKVERIAELLEHEKDEHKRGQLERELEELGKDLQEETDKDLQEVTP